MESLVIYYVLRCLFHGNINGYTQKQPVWVEIHGIYNLTATLYRPDIEIKRGKIIKHTMSVLP